MKQEIRHLDFFERYLTIWVLGCMAIGVTLGMFFPETSRTLGALEFTRGSHINAPIAVLIWLMIYPMMLKVDFGGLREVVRKPKGLAITLVVNWLIKPFSMALLGWIFLHLVFKNLGLMTEEAARDYNAGLIILAAAPCTAMVFVWSYLTNGDSAYTLAQVAVNDLIMLFLFAPIVMLLVGVTGVVVPAQVLIASVVTFIVLPLIAAFASRVFLIRAKGKEWFEQTFLQALKPVTIGALLATLALIFMFQSRNIRENWLAVVLIAVPITIQVYFNAGITYWLMKIFRVPHNVAAPGSLIGASNFFELAVAVAITLFGTQSGAALATIVGVLVEVPVMLSVCRICVGSRSWYQASTGSPATSVDG